MHSPVTFHKIYSITEKDIQTVQERVHRNDRSVSCSWCNRNAKGRQNDDPIEHEMQEQENNRNDHRIVTCGRCLLARIYNLFPLLCPTCGAEIQVIAVIQDKPVINKILKSVGEMTEPPILSPARGSPSWDDYSQEILIADMGGQSIPDYEFNQSVSW
ncbi:MAG: hypothetical protein KZQ83_16670 [gamma proteobacterium symbiont of Taylorina sp.]|nr:hypothetical protein [gamma proteobacterium symbiont of Taylorina sp.]